MTVQLSLIIALLVCFLCFLAASYRASKWAQKYKAAERNNDILKASNEAHKATIARVGRERDRYMARVTELSQDNTKAWASVRYWRTQCNRERTASGKAKLEGPPPTTYN